jgi:NDP-sugar pyrophosphorylase family protein
MSDASSIVGIVLAAGLGNRLRPSTLYCPKPLIPVAGVEPIFFALHQFHSIGIKRVIVNVHYLPHQITEAINTWKKTLEGMEIRISYEMNEILGTGGALLKISEENSDWLKGSGLLLQNGDTLAHFDLSKLYTNLHQSCMAVSYREDFLEKYNPLWVSEQNQWVGIGREPKEDSWKAAHFFGVHYLCPDAIQAFRAFCGETRFVDLFNGIYRPLSDHGFSFHAVEFLADRNSGDFWFDMNNKEFLLKAQEFLLQDTQINGWDHVLRARHPGIEEVEKGVWFKSLAPRESFAFQSPVVFVDENTDAVLGKSPLAIGPSVSWVQEKSLPHERNPLQTKNAVVMLKKSWQHDIPQEILNDIVLA